MRALRSLVTLGPCRCAGVPLTPPITQPIPQERASDVTLDTFEASFYKQDRSVVLTNATDGWGAAAAELGTKAGLWRCFAEEHGHRTVPVEVWQPVVAGQEAEGGLDERLMTLRDFTERHLLRQGW